MGRPCTRATCLGGLAAAVGAAFVPGVVRAQQLTTLRVGATVSDFFGEPYYVNEAGTFTRSGFRVEPLPLPNAGATTAALAGGAWTWRSSIPYPVQTRSSAACRWR